MSNDTNLDREKFKAVMSNMNQLEQMQENNFDNFQLAHDMLYLKGELNLDPPLTNGELYTLASKTLWASRNTNCCYLHAERVEAVRVLLEFGTAAPRAIEGIPAMDADKMRSFLQACDIGVFSTLVDCVSEQNERFYSPETFILSSPAYASDFAALKSALTAALEQRPPLSAQISDAAQRTGAHAVGFAPGKDLGR